MMSSCIPDTDELPYLHCCRLSCGFRLFFIVKVDISSIRSCLETLETGPVVRSYQQNEEVVSWTKNLEEDMQ